MPAKTAVVVYPDASRWIERRPGFTIKELTTAEDADHLSLALGHLHGRFPLHHFTVGTEIIYVTSGSIRIEYAKGGRSSQVITFGMSVILEAPISFAIMPLDGPAELTIINTPAFRASHVVFDEEV